MLDIESLSPNLIKQMDFEELPEMADEIRRFLIRSVNQSGGHLASNLGVVELTIALHRVFDLPQDKIVWDVGHQAYVHKILTGRACEFSTLRQKDGLCGFPRRSESEYDAFDTGHSSTSLSAAMGIAQGLKSKGLPGRVVSVIGDGALTGGMVYEALNHIGSSKTPMIIILNDNGMSISNNVGAMHYHLSRLRAGMGYINFKKQISHRMPRLKRTLERIKNSVKYLFLQSAFFEELGVKYLGPINGHDLRELETVLHKAQNFDVPVLIHALTVKGKGYEPAEDDPEKFHGIAPLLIENKNKKAAVTPIKLSNSAVFGQALEELAQQHDDVVAITAAMPKGTGLLSFSKHFPDRFYDVGIAEQHAVTFAAGLATTGMKPFVAIYSTFMQRAYDQILHDVCLQKLPVVLALDRAGLVGDDGATHHGVYDISYLSGMPNMVCCAPGTQQELEAMLRFAYEYKDGPISIRYPRAALMNSPLKEEISLGKWQMINGALNDIIIISLSDMLETAQKVSHMLREKGYASSLVNARFIKPLDEEMLQKMLSCHLVVVIEDGVLEGGLGQQIAAFLAQYGMTKVKCFALPEEPLEHGKVELLLQEAGMDPETITLEICRELGLKGTYARQNKA